MPLRQADTVITFIEYPLGTSIHCSTCDEQFTTGSQPLLISRSKAERWAYNHMREYHSYNSVRADNVTIEVWRRIHE